MSIKRLSEMAKEISSKNSGNHFLTFDIVFDTHEAYQTVKSSGVLTAEKVASLYGVPAASIVAFVHFDQGNAFKITMRRPWVSGGLGESDVFGAQQYAPLLDLAIPV